MYTKQEASLIRKNFWTSFGQYMKPLPGADGQMVNWLNYKTGLKHVYFRMDADKQQAVIAIEITHPDEAVRQQYYGHLLQLKKILQQTTGEAWSWEMNAINEYGKPLSRIGTVLKDVNLFNTQDWPAIISFLKPRIIALDEFWNLVKDGFAN